MKQYVGFVRDHSASMRSLAGEAAADYNTNIDSIKKASTKHELDTIINTVKCGVGRHGEVARETVNSTVHMLKPISRREYDTEGGGTPLFDSVGELVELMKAVPDYNDPEVSFLVVAITDGYENRSYKYDARRLTQLIQDLQASDRWTFTFRVPHGGHAHNLAAMGIPRGNILEWEQTQAGFRHATEVTSQAFDNFYTQRSLGKRSSSSFYTDLTSVSRADVQNELGDISHQVEVFNVTHHFHDAQIRDFISKKRRKPYVKGTAFYQLTKSEEVQDYKQVIILDKVSQSYYAGVEARRMLGLPAFGYVRVRPGDHANFEVFIQSTSVNRKVKQGTKVIYWSGGVGGH